MGKLFDWKNFQKYLVFVSLFSTQIGSKQANLFVSYKKRIPFFKSNNVKYCQILPYCGHLETYLVIFEPFLHVFYTIRHLQILKTNIFLFWINISNQSLIIFSFWFFGIWHYSTYYCFDFFSFWFVLWFESPFLFVSIGL